ncbi:MAG: hypothetical protein HYR97_03315 [Candidatus Melainabacteria bacterium]|nr:hypothetical protein [Candidatus Melainabacteria bacterium]
MRKKQKTKKEETNKPIISFSEILKDKTNIDFILCGIIILLLFIPSLARPWLFYDERIIYDSLYFPVARSFGEIVEIINEFGLNFNLVSSNMIYSSNYITRNAPFGQLLGLILSYIFNKSPILFHGFSLILHIINSFLLYLILKVFLKITIHKEAPISKFSRFLSAGLAFIWAIYPVNVESVMLASNFGALFSYLFFFGFILEFLINRTGSQNLLRFILIPFLFLVPMLTNEYIVTLPFIIFTISFYLNFGQSKFLKALKLSFEESKPYLIGFIFFLYYFFFISNYKTSQLGTFNSLVITLERVFWLAPGETLTDPYSIFCIAFLTAWLLIPLIMLLTKKRFSNIFLMCFLFFLGLLPFLHILMPSYTLVAERYLYTASALLIISISQIINSKINQNSQVSIRATVLIGLLLISITSFTRSFLRTQDWKNDYTFINATYKTSTDPLFKAMRLGMLAKTQSVLAPDKAEENKKLFIQTLGLLEEAKNDIKAKSGKQKKLPAVLKAYGLDHKSLLAKIAFLEASTRYLELNEDYKTGLTILEPFTKDISKLDPRIVELYVHLLLKNDEYTKARDVLIETDKNYPNTNFVLGALIDVLYTNIKDSQATEQYLKKALSVFLYDNSILLKAVNFYQEEKKEAELAKYSYLYGLRTGSKHSYIQSFASYLNINDLRNAKRAMDKMLVIDAFDPEGLYFVSKYYYQINDTQKALEYMVQSHENTKFIQTTPQVVFDITNNLAKLYVHLEMHEQALRLKDELWSLAGNDRSNLIQVAQFLKLVKLDTELNRCIQKIKTLSNS